MSIVSVPAALRACGPISPRPSSPVRVLLVALARPDGGFPMRRRAGRVMNLRVRCSATRAGEERVLARDAGAGDEPVRASGIDCNGSMRWRIEAWMQVCLRFAAALLWVLMKGLRAGWGCKGCRAQHLAGAVVRMQVPRVCEPERTAGISCACAMRGATARTRQGRSRLGVRVGSNCRKVDAIGKTRMLGAKR